MTSILIDIAMIALFAAFIVGCAVWLEYRENKRVRRIIQDAIREAKKAEMENES